MAKSEHQGLQIALILFVMVAVVLAITTFVFYRQADERGKLKEAADKGKQDADTQKNDADSRLQYALHILGVEPLDEAQEKQLRDAFAADPKMKKAIDNYDNHMATYGGAGLTKQDLNYDKLLPKMLQVVRQMNLASVQREADNKSYKDDRDNIQKTEAERTEEAKKKQAESDKKLGDELAKYGEDRSKLEAQQQKELETFTSKLKQNETQIAMVKGENDKNQKELKKQLGVIETQAKTIREFRDEPFEVADGKIESVSQAANIVWINLGLADGLRRQTMFSVYDLADNGVKRTSPKASIEITRVIDQHLAEARIVSDDPANPILPNDQIFSPAWRPGKRIRFALAGFLDIDGDQHSDRNLIRSLLLSSGGQIDCEMHDDGTIEGEMTSNTRYLVLGDTPTDKNDAKVLAGWSKMTGEANQYGVETINVDKMLEWVGYRPEVRTVGLGKNATAAPKIRKPPAKSAAEEAKEKFRERRPPQATGSAASN
jgi:hypothetical protein